VLGKRRPGALVTQSVAHEVRSVWREGRDRAPYWRGPSGSVTESTTRSSSTDPTATRPGSSSTLTVERPAAQGAERLTVVMTLSALRVGSPRAAQSRRRSHSAAAARNAHPSAKRVEVRLAVAKEHVPQQHGAVPELPFILVDRFEGNGLPRQQRGHFQQDTSP
jgi:hypothetical protein